MPTLAKYSMFAETKHPRGTHGEFAVRGSVGTPGSNGAPSFRVRPLAEASPGPRFERRSLTRGEAWQRLGRGIAAIPASYTGSSERERPVDSWKELRIAWQVPKKMPVEQHMATLQQLKQIIDQHREPAIEKAKETRQLVAVHGIKDRFDLKRRTGALTLDPETPKGAVHRAYNHAAMLALHDFGVVDYGPFKMSDAQKQELTPLVPFMRYVRRRLGNAMRSGAMKGASAPYREAFGQPFADRRRDLQGRVRLRVRPNQEFVKLAKRDFGQKLAALEVRRKGPDAHLLTEDEVRAAARQAQQPSPAQAEAGNYRMGHVRIGGLDVTIENAKGSIRRKVGRGGQSWQVRMPAHYGYVKRSAGADGDHVDVYLGPHAHEADKHPVYVVDQVNAHTGQFDEHKCMLGFRNARHARRTYDAGFSDGKGPHRRGAITRMSWPDFKDWVTGPDTKRPLVKGGIAMDLPFAELLTKAAGSAAQQAKVKLVMHEWKAGKLRSWRGRNAKGQPRRGPVVRDQRQAVAIALSQAGLSKVAGCLDPRVAQMHGAAMGVLRKAGAAHARGAADAHVVTVMPEVDRLIPHLPMATPATRMDRNEIVADSRLPLATILGKAVASDLGTRIGATAGAAGATAGALVGAMTVPRAARITARGGARLYHAVGRRLSFSAIGPETAGSAAADFGHFAGKVYGKEIGAAALGAGAYLAGRAVGNAIERYRQRRVQRPTMVKSAAHPGFDAVANRISRSEGVSRAAAGAILGAAGRRAGKAAIKRNPRLKRVLGRRRGKK